MQTTASVAGLDFSSESFVVQSALIGTTYAIKTEAGEYLLEAKRKFFDDEDAYVYSDSSEQEIFRYEHAEGETSRPDFQLVDATSETVLGQLRAVADAEYEWAFVPAEVGQEVHIEGKRTGIPILQSLRGRKMAVTDSAGSSVGNVRRRVLSVRFTFDIDLHGLDGVTTAATVLAVPLLYDVMQEVSRGW